MVRISDFELVKILMENARAPFINIARAFKVSETAVRKRIRKLEEKGIIKKYTVIADLRKLGYDVNALIGIDTAPESYIKVIDELKKMSEVISLYSSSGDHMIMIETWLKNSEELSNFIKKIESIEGVVRVCPAVILERIK